MFWKVLEWSIVHSLGHFRHKNTSTTFDELYTLLLSEETQLRLDNLQLTVAIPPTLYYSNTKFSTGRGYEGHSRGRGFLGRVGSQSGYGRPRGYSSYSYSASRVG